jgi:hypothetical protein
LSTNVPVDTIERGWTPLLAACEKGHAAIVQVLLAAGADVKRTTPGRKLTALHVASYLGFADVVKLLIRAGAPIDAVSEDGSTPLHSAVTGDHVPCVTALIGGGAALMVHDRRGLDPGALALRLGRRAAADAICAALQASAPVAAGESAVPPLLQCKYGATCRFVARANLTHCLKYAHPAGVQLPLLFTFCRMHGRRVEQFAAARATARVPCRYDGACRYLIRGDLAHCLEFSHPSASAAAAVVRADSLGAGAPVDPRLEALLGSIFGVGPAPSTLPGAECVCGIHLF